jgi:protein gp37
MSNIEWTQQTWNPVVGCSKVSAGCQNCYAINQAYRNAAIGKQMPSPGRLAYYEGLTEKRGNRVEWTGAVRFVPEALEIPLRRKKPTTWFVNSMSDLFHESVSLEELFEIASVMLATPQHTYQVLTKRPERMAEAWAEVLDLLQDAVDATSITPTNVNPLPNVWLGVTVENQKAADERIPFLLQTPAAVRFLSCEPLLEEIDINKAMYPDGGYSCFGFFDGFGYEVFLQWVIVGGESGTNARPCKVDHIRSIVKQCRDANVPVFVKQLGSNADYPVAGKGSNIDEFPDDLKVRGLPV